MNFLSTLGTDEVPNTRPRTKNNTKDTTNSNGWQRQSRTNRKTVRFAPEAIEIEPRSMARPQRQRSEPAANRRLTMPRSMDPILRSVQARREKLVQELADAMYKKKRQVVRSKPPACSVNIEWEFDKSKFNSMEKHLFKTCIDERVMSGVGIGFISKWFFTKAPSMRKPFMVTAWDAKTLEPRVRAYALGHVGTSSVSIDVLCGRDAANRSRHCKHLSAAIVRQIEQFARAHGKNVTLQAVPTAVGFYAQLGYARHLDPCRPGPRSWAAANYVAEPGIRAKYERLHMLGNADLKKLAMYDGVYFGGNDKNHNGLIFMSKCVTDLAA